MTDQAEDKSDRKGRRNEFRRKSILMAAREMFQEAAFDDLRIESIADAAGLSKATLYQYFSGKAEIYDAILMSDVHELIEGIEKSWSSSSRFSTNIRRMTYFYISFFVRHQEYFTNMSFYYLPGRHIPLPEETMTRVRSYLNRAIGTIAACLDDAAAKGEIQSPDSTTTAIAIYCAWEGAAWTYATGRCQQYDRDVYDIAIRAVDLIAAGLKQGGSEPTDEGARIQAS